VSAELRDGPAFAEQSNPMGQSMTLRAAALTLIALAGTASADDAPQPDPSPYPAPPPPDPAQQPQPYYPPPQQYPQQYPPPQPYPYGYAPMPAPVPDPTLDGPKSTGTGVVLSLAGTFGLPLLAAALSGSSEDSNNQNDDLVTGMLITSAVLGPSVGRMYAGDFLTVGLGLRALAMTMILVGVHSDSISTDDEIGYVVGGSLLLIGGGIADFAGIGRSVRDYNFEFAKARVAPMVVPTSGPNGMTGATVGLTGSF
jgi:hypothetical protein